MSNPTSSLHCNTAYKLRLAIGKLAASFATLAVAATALVALSAQPASTHSHLPTSGCVNDTFISKSERSDGLVQDCLTLIAILDHWPGALSVRDWGANGQNIKFWPGVKVSGGRVTELNLQAKFLTDTIPAEIGDLTALTRLNLSHNYLTGLIPEEIGSLTELTSLNLSYNSLSGPIPSEIGQLTELTQLRLNRNNLEGGIIRDLGKLAKLRWLDLSSNRLRGSIPSDVVKLARFQGGRLGLFGFCRNHLSGSVPEPLQFGIILIGYPASQGYNPIACQTKPSPITTAPLEVPERPQSSTVAGCSDGTFVEQPAYTAAESHIGLVRDCRALFALKDRCTSLATRKWGSGLIRTINFWDGVTVRDGRVTRLSLRDEPGTRKDESLNCILPEEIGNLTALTSLDLSGANLYGPIPKEIGNLTQLTRLNLQNNDLTDLIPPEIGKLKKLTSLDLSRNDLTGPIPNEIGSLAELISLYLNSNQLSGNIPRQIGYLAKLDRLELGDNNLWGKIPAQMGNMAALTSLGLRDNLLSQSIPAELGNLSELTYLDLSRNNLSGPIPSELSELGELQTLNLYDNLLTGSIPQAVNDLRRPSGKLVFFDYCRNYLSQIDSPGLLGCQKIPPTTLGACSVITGAVEDEAIAEEYEDADNLNLLVLDCRALFAIERHWYGIPEDRDLLRNTDFWSGVAITNGRVTSMYLPAISLTKEIPREIGQLTELATLDLSRNELIGPIHAELANLSKLIWLDLSKNQLTGYIPAELGTLSQLAWLDISDNQIAGRIPAELSSLRNLRTLDISNNKLWTTISPVLGNMPKLNVLDLSNNNFLGAIPANLGSLNTLISLDISHNQLTGSIPSELGSLAEAEGGNLKVFSFCGNRLTGAVPEALRPVLANPEASAQEDDLDIEAPIDIILTDYPAGAEYDPIECQIPSTG